jgi:hypothetical protein
VAVYSAVENKVAQGWGRAVKYYEGLKFVYEIQSRLEEWKQQAAEEEQKPDQKKAPQQTAPPPNKGENSGNPK